MTAARSIKGEEWSEPEEYQIDITDSQRELAAQETYHGFK